MKRIKRLLKRLYYFGTVYADEVKLKKKNPYERSCQYSFKLDSSCKYNPL